MNKKLYVAPEIIVSNVVTHNMLSTSNTCLYYFTCPYIPETRCNKYNNFVYDIKGFKRTRKFVPAWNKFYVQGTEVCPYKKDCKTYQIYKSITDERTR